MEIVVSMIDDDLFKMMQAEARNTVVRDLSERLLANFTLNSTT